MKNILIGIALFAVALTANATKQSDIEPICEVNAQKRPVAERVAFKENCIRIMSEPTPKWDPNAPKPKCTGCMVIVGMTIEDAKNSWWGKPKYVNKTMNQYGTREQWVYGNGNYLYFENGILTSITTSR